MEKTIDKLSDTTDIESFCKMEDFSPRSQHPPKNLPDKNEKLGDVLFRVFGYPSKVYYKTIASFIKSYTHMGDVVLDPMAGTGSAGLAALLAGRKAILNDGSLLASFASKNLLLPVKPWKLKAAFLRLKEKVKNRIENLYLITCPHCGEERPVQTIISSDVYKCPNCCKKFPLYKNRTNKKATYSCPNCNFEINAYRHNNKNFRIERRRPIEAKYSCENCNCGEKSHTLDINKSTIEKWNSILEDKAHLFEKLWIPDERVVTDRWYTRLGSWPGFEKEAKFVDLFTRRNLLALIILNDAIEKFGNGDIKSQLKFAFLSSLARASNRMYTTSVVKTYYQIPAVGKVQNVWRVFERKFSTLLRSKSKLKEIFPFQEPRELPAWVRVLNEDAKELNLPKNSVDYVFLDPPRGSQIGYYELNSFYSCWLKEGPEDLEGEVIIPMESDNVDKYAKEWCKMMFPIFKNIIQILKPDRFMTVMFHNLSNKIWNYLRNMLEISLKFKYIGYVDPERGTTFHTNRLSETSQRVAFITYQRRGEEISFPSNIEDIVLMQELPPSELEFLKSEIKRRKSKKTDLNLREAQSIAIKVVHENELSCIPSYKQLKNLISNL